MISTLLRNTRHSFHVAFTSHISGDLCDGCVVVLRCWCGNTIGYKHTEIWQLWRDQEESREVQLTCQPREEGRGGCYSQYSVPGGGIHSQGDDLIWAQIDEKLSVVFWTNNGKTSPSQWSWRWQRSFIIKLHSWTRLSPGDWFSSDKGTLVQRGEE